MNKENLKEAFRVVTGHEGGYVDDPFDAGGKTKWGITDSTLGYFSKAKGLDYEKGVTIKDLTYDQALDVFEWFLSKWGIDRLENQGIINSLADMAWGGPKRRKTLREGVGFLAEKLSIPFSLDRSRGTKSLLTTEVTPLGEDPGLSQALIAVTRIDYYIGRGLSYENKVANGESLAGISPPCRYLKGWIARVLAKDLIPDVHQGTPGGEILLTALRHLKASNPLLDSKFDTSGTCPGSSTSRKRKYELLFDSSTNILWRSHKWLKDLV